MNRLHSGCYRTLSDCPLSPKTVKLLTELSLLTKSDMANQPPVVVTYWKTLELPRPDGNDPSESWNKVFALASFLAEHGLTDNFIHVVDTFEEAFSTKVFSNDGSQAKLEVIVGALDQCPALNDVRLSNGGLTLAHQSALIGCPTLAVLTLDNCCIAPETDRLGEPTGGSSSLRELSVILKTGATCDNMLEFLGRLGCSPLLTSLAVKTFDLDESLRAVRHLLGVVGPQLESLSVRADPPQTIIGLLNALASRQGRRALNYLEVEGNFYELKIEDESGDLLKSLCAMLKATPSLQNLRIGASFSERAVDALLDILERLGHVVLVELVQLGSRVNTRVQQQRFDALRFKHQTVQQLLAAITDSPPRKDV